MRFWIPVSLFPSSVKRLPRYFNFYTCLFLVSLIFDLLFTFFKKNAFENMFIGSSFKRHVKFGKISPARAVRGLQHLWKKVYRVESNLSTTKMLLKSVKNRKWRMSSSCACFWYLQFIVHNLLSPRRIHHMIASENITVYVTINCCLVKSQVVL